MTLIASQCALCKHYTGDAVPPACDAFPDGIPEAVLMNRRDHRRPYPDDQGIRWEPVEPEFRHPLGSSRSHSRRVR